MGFASEGTGPGDVAVAGGVVGIAAFAEDPFAPGVGFAEGKVVSGDVERGFREALFRDGELVHEGEAEIVLFRGEVDGDETAGKGFGGLPTNLLAEAGGVAGRLDPREVFEEKEEDGFEKVPVLGADGEKRAEP